MKSAGFIAIVVALLVLSQSYPASAHSQEDLNQAENIIVQKIPCSNLSEEQLELLGDYYMEQMHPGNQHTSMDEMMGGEGSETLRDMHIRMARAFYCGEHEAMSPGMMSMMVGKGELGEPAAAGAGNFMMGSMMDEMMRGMMASSRFQSKGGGSMMNNWGMMSASGWFGMSLLWLIYVGLAAFVFGVIFWWTYKLVMKPKK